MSDFELTTRRVFVLFAAVTAVVYANAFRGLFHLDDAGILADARLASVTAYVRHVPGMIRPALRLTFLVDRALWGGNPAGYHLLNVLLHFGSVLLFHAIVLRLTGKRGPALVASLLFLVHPIATETVTYVSGRASGLMAFFYLAALYGYVRGSHALAVGCFVLSLLSKEIALTFPLALLLVEHVARQRSGKELGEAVRRFHLPFWGVTAAFLLAAASTPRYVYLFDVSRRIRPMAANLLAQIDVVAYALSLFVVPGRLSVEHDLGGAAFAWPAPGSVLLIAGLLALAIACLRRAPLAAFGLLWFFLQILPTNSVLARYDALSERNLYLAAPGLFLAVASLASARLPARGGAFVARGISVGVLALLAMATVDRNALYATSVEFWADAARKAPAKARPHVNLGCAYYADGDFDRAMAEFRRALALDREDPVAQADLLAAWHMKENGQ